MFKQPDLKYKFDALEPYIDKETMEVHYGKHHKGYTEKFNSVIEKYPELTDKTAEKILKNLSSLAVSDEDRKKIKNNGGGFLNHSLFWEIMDPANSVDEKLTEEIKTKFGDVEKFKEIFSETAMNRFGSGWAWLVRNDDGKLEVYSLPNQDSPLSLGHTPILGIDVWEHAYYLKYKNKRADYINNWWNTIKII